MMSNVFFSRCKPRGISAVDVALNNNILFVGYPLRRIGAEYQRHALSKCVVDLKAGWEEWSENKDATKANEPSYARAAQANRNLAADVEDGDIALIPDASNGLVYAGCVKGGGFRLVDNPAWYDELLATQLAADPQLQDRPEDGLWLAAEVAQICEVDEWKPIARSSLPGWITAALFGRSTHGRVKPNPHAGEPHQILSDLIAGKFERREWTTDPVEAKRRLIADMDPTAFEYLIVDLLQLEHPALIWRRGGGAGDGGADGTASDDDGKVAGVLQCKLVYDGGEVFNPSLIRKLPLRYLAALLHLLNVTPDPNVAFLDSDAIVKLLLKHHDRLPLAITMRIGDGEALTATAPDAPVAQ